MQKIYAVIGANYGDEGKGLMTDYFADKHPEGLVIRHNGGAQAGHTVETPDGVRHVFGHFGSGTLCGLPTYLSEYFVVNPMLFNREWAALTALSTDTSCGLEPHFIPSVAADPHCMVTTPFDILLNQIAEASRGMKRHGSCGVGFNETIQRSLSESDFQIHLHDLSDEALVRQKLDVIRFRYIPLRLAELGIEIIPAPYDSLLENDALVERFITDVGEMCKHLILTDISLLHRYDTLIFEGAQGLMLDQSHAFFPHVTRSNTGLQNVVSLLEKAHRVGPIDVVYMTRAYLTRHGAGPLATELPNKPYPDIVDMTNMPNPYQGTLRYGLLDMDVLADAIHTDLKVAVHRVKYSLDLRLHLGITCLDQVPDTIIWWTDGSLLHGDHALFVSQMLKKTGIPHGYGSFGPTRADVHTLDTSFFGGSCPCFYLPNSIMSNAVS